MSTHQTLGIGTTMYASIRIATSLFSISFADYCCLLYSWKVYHPMQWYWHYYDSFLIFLLL